MNKTNKILIIILSILIIIAIVVGIMIFSGNDNEQDNGPEIASTTVEERKAWSKFLRANPYLSELEITEGYLLDDTDLIKLAISSEEIKTERIVTSEIQKTPTLSKGDGYKKSIESINKYIETRIANAKIAYNFVETYLEGEQYLLLGEEYVYYTKIDLPKREYIAMDLKKDGNNFEAKIYEYETNDENKNQVKEMLENGTINPEIQKSKTYTITGTMDNEDIRISTKQ